jgi:hypothetical protein
MLPYSLVPVWTQEPEGSICWHTAWSPLPRVALALNECCSGGRTILTMAAGKTGERHRRRTGVPLPESWSKVGRGPVANR